jgi:hypothetical protein
MTAPGIDPLRLDRYERPGIYRRRLRLEAAPGRVRVDLEDDPHRYGLTLSHDGERVTAIEGHALRTPWTTCREAVTVLDRLVGMPLHPDPQQVYRHANGREQCTHLFDLAGLAVAHAARGTRRREYDAEVPCVDPGAPREVVLRRDGREVLRWTLARDTIVAPEEAAGQSVAGLMPWARSHSVDRDRFEAVWILRRAVFTAGNRFHDLDRMERASDTGHVLSACYVFREGVAHRALRVAGATRDFTDPGVPFLDALPEVTGAAPRKA